MLLDERNDIVFLLPGWLETALSLPRYNELVAPDAPSLAVSADERGKTQAETSVLTITGIEQYILDVEPLHKIVMCQILFLHYLIFITSCWEYRILIGENRYSFPSCRKVNWLYLFPVAQVLPGSRTSLESLSPAFLGHWFQRRI